MDRLAASIRAEGRAWENIIAYSTEEVIRQRAAPEAVGWMLSAWITAPPNEFRCSAMNSSTSEAGVIG